MSRRRRRFGRRARRAVRCAAVVVALHVVPAAPAPLEPIVRDLEPIVCPFVPPCFGGPDVRP